MTFRRSGVVVAVLAATMLLACSSSPSKSASSSSSSPPAQPTFFAPLPPSDQVLTLVSNAGLQAETAESLQHHVHAHLDIFVNGQPKLIPGGVGIVITDPAVHHGVDSDGNDEYGGISPPCATPCISPLHTHDATGTLHTESATDTDNTLGQLFTEWGVRLDGQCVGDFCTSSTPIKVVVNGKEVPLSTARDIPLTDQKEIAIVIGTPPATVPSTPDFHGAA
jgi:hypothetical protein